MDKIQSCCIVRDTPKKQLEYGNTDIRRMDKNILPRQVQKKEESWCGNSDVRQTKTRDERH